MCCHNVYQDGNELHNRQVVLPREAGWGTACDDLRRFYWCNLNLLVCIRQKHVMENRIIQPIRILQDKGSLLNTKVD